MKVNLFLLSLVMLSFSGCNPKMENDSTQTADNYQKQIYEDIPFVQELSIQYPILDGQRTVDLFAVESDRDGNIKVLSDKGMLAPQNGELFNPGTLAPDISYGPMTPKKIVAMTTYQDYFVYLDDQYIFSNAWAGKIQITHGMPKAKLFAAGNDFHFLVYDGTDLVYMDDTGKKTTVGHPKGIIQILYQEKQGRFILVSQQHIFTFVPGENALKEQYSGEDLTCAALADLGERIVVGTKKGYFYLDEKKIISKVPWPEITCIREISGELWFGSGWGVFKLGKDGKYSYFSGERWLPGNKVIHLAEGPENSVLTLTANGLAQIQFKKMTLFDKAMFYEKQVRQKNIRYGFNCSQTDISEGYDSPIMKAQPSDNLWTAMYMASQLYRYKVTGEEEARINAYEAFEALERLHTITGIKGLFARSFERDHEIIETKEEGWEIKELFSGSPAQIWLPGNDHSNWAWRSTASSDQTVGQLFALTTILELVDDTDWRQRALACLDNLMGYIVDHDFYIIDVDGLPTLWGKWNPDYVNEFPDNVGDKRLYSSNIISFLQTAYKFTGKEKYRSNAYKLMDEYGYLENLMRPIAEIGPSDADELSKTLSVEWNHSDDEMYFLAYPGLYNYAFTPELKEKYHQSITDHWQLERSEKNPLWNFIFSITGSGDFDLDGSVWYLKQYPIDLRNWAVHNSQRKDIDLIPENFRGQTTAELLPLAELPLHRHNLNVFDIDREGNGKNLISAGDTWLLPYWMGRYLGVIGNPN
ncbi:MAG TPA: hypothetical protein VLZ54_11655 [Arenibacter sp.]|nr:hypothetical protein [Arenibacter sp.]